MESVRWAVKLSFETRLKRRGASITLGVTKTFRVASEKCEVYLGHAGGISKSVGCKLRTLCTQSRNGISRMAVFIKATVANEKFKLHKVSSKCTRQRVQL